MAIKEHIDLEYIRKAQAVFERFRKDMVNDRDKAGAVQAFEFCYELSWKLLKRVLQSRGVETATPRDTFRVAFQAGIIADPELWFSFQKKRNLSSDTYNEENLDIIVESFDLFSAELNKLITKVESLP